LRISIIFSCKTIDRKSFEDLNTPYSADLSIRFLHTSPIIKKNNLIAHWSFDEGSGYKCIDWSGNQLTAYIMGHNWNTDANGLPSSFR